MEQHGIPQTVQLPEPPLPDPGSADYFAILHGRALSTAAKVAVQLLADRGGRGDEARAAIERGDYRTACSIAEEAWGGWLDARAGAAEPARADDAIFEPLADPDASNPGLIE